MKANKKDISKPSDTKTNDNTEWPNDINELAGIVFFLLGQRETETKKQLLQLENELRTQNRFFPQNEIIRKIDDLIDGPHKKLKSGTILFRARTIDKYQEEKFLRVFYDEINKIVKKKIPDFDVRYDTIYSSNVMAYIMSANSDKPLVDLENDDVFFKYKTKSWWGYSKKESDAPPSQYANIGRINPKGISYLYAAGDERTAALEVRPVISQLVSIAEICIKKDIKLFDFNTNFQGDDANNHINASVDWFVLSQFFSQPNYSGDSAYLATQYISEYIKNIKDEAGKPVFDGLCFQSSLNEKGLNYVLFDTSKKRKYKITSSKLCQVNDLVGNLTQILPIEDNSLHI